MNRMVTLRHTETGETIERHPIDAREIMAIHAGKWVTDDPRMGAMPEAPPAPRVFEAEEAPGAVLIEPWQPGEVPKEHSPGVPLTVTTAADAPPARPLEWTSKMPPDEYLKRWPGGSRAADARAALSRSSG